MKNERPAESEKIGYRNPPKQHRFKKGKSGNPLGRPIKRGISALGGQFDEAAIREASRTVMVVDEHGQKCLPIVDVVLRKIYAASVNGDIRSQRLLAKELRAAENGKRRRDAELFGAAIEYKSLCADYAATSGRKMKFRLDPEEIIVDARSKRVSLSPANFARKAKAVRVLKAMLAAGRRHRSSLRLLLSKHPENSFIQFDIEILEERMLAVKSALPIGRSNVL